MVVKIIEVRIYFNNLFMLFLWPLTTFEKIAAVIKHKNIIIFLSFFSLIFIQHFKKIYLISVCLYFFFFFFSFKETYYRK